ncbi:MAG: Hsp20/alpha crystallin family protein [Treponema sp.]|nr:Hsp20/alpha crystallin family protein [Treponema sp.]
MNEITTFDTLFNTVFGNAFDSARTNWVPDVDVTQTKESYNIEMDLPGMTQDCINVELNQNVLTIASKNEETKQTQEPSEKTESEEEKEITKWLLKERCSRSFKRSFTLPKDIDGQNVTASFKNGVLSVKVMRKAPEEPKRIQINVA